MADRARWSSRMIFVFAAIGSAVGLGNVWRFPYLAGKYGGGAFLIPYLIALIIMGIPLLILEFALGQKMQRGAVHAFAAIKRKFMGVGLMAIFTGFTVVSYYAVVMAWSLMYLFYSFTLKYAGDTKDFFFNKALQISSSIGEIGGINLTILLTLVVIWVLIYFCVWKGVKSVGKVVVVTMPLPVILILILVLRGLTLPNSLEGIIFYLKPNFAALFDTEVWTAAMSQIFFTLSLAFGIMIAYASYMKKDSDITKNAVITSVVNSAISIIAGFAVFGTLGYMAFKQAVPVSELAAAGPSLAFIVYPKAITMIPMAALFGVIFFVTLLTLAIDSAFSLVEGVTTVVSDAWHKASRPLVSLIVCALGFLAGIIFTTRAGLYFLDVVDHFATNFGLIIVGILECIAVGWVFGAEKLRKYINEVSDYKIGKWWSFCIKYLIPILLIYLIAVQFVAEMKANYEGYPNWAIVIGWLVVLVPLAISFIVSYWPEKKKAVATS
ncbi:sodium-dependent transporter [Candidatus Woesearchaeota archaeon]|nr:MAG: sodium-dependent transporter [Candidatus Woesearchaeota archaeon]